MTDLYKSHFYSISPKAPASIEGTQEVVERLTFVLETLFGRMWSFTSDASRSDTAYSTLKLGAHTDATFMDYPAGYFKLVFDFDVLCVKIVCRFI